MSVVLTPSSPSCTPALPSSGTSYLGAARRAVGNMMLVMLVISLFVALLLCSVIFPSIWVPSGDDFLDAHEAGLSLISARKPLASCVSRGGDCSDASINRKSSAGERPTDMHGQAHYDAAFGASRTPWISYAARLSPPKLNQAHQKRRCSSHSRQVAYTFSSSPVRPARNKSWRFGRSHPKQYY